MWINTEIWLALVGDIRKWLSDPVFFLQTALYQTIREVETDVKMTLFFTCLNVWNLNVWNIAYGSLQLGNNK